MLDTHRHAERDEYRTDHAPRDPPDLPTSTVPVEGLDQFVDLVEDLFHLILGGRITDDRAQLLDDVAIVRRAVDGVVEILLGDFALRTGGSFRADRPLGSGRAFRSRRSGGDGIDEVLETVELGTHLVGIDFRAGLGKVGIEGHDWGGVED